MPSRVFQLKDGKDAMPFNFSFRKPKTYVLMHKDIPVLSAEYDRSTSSFTKLIEIRNLDHVPYSAVKNEQEVSLKRLNHWYRWRGIPDYRLGLDRLMNRLGISDPSELLNHHYAVSVSDHYWLKEEDNNITYDKVSFFTHAFDQDGFARAMFSLGRAEPEDSALNTPNNTLAGYQKKAWFHKGNDLYLYKGGTFPCQLEPVHEKLASEIGRRLGMDVVDYTTSIYENQVVSICRNMLDEHHDLITADEVLSFRKPDKDTFDYFSYVKILEDKGVANAQKAMDDMLVLDFIMMNTDRHNQNLGVIINTDTMQWEKAAPIFDTGTGLACLRPDDEVDGWSQVYNYKLFNSNKIPDSVISYLIKDFSRYDFTALRDVLEYYYNAMKETQVISGISEQRIESQVKLLAERIRAIYKLQKKAAHRG